MVGTIGLAGVPLGEPVVLAACDDDTLQTSSTAVEAVLGDRYASAYLDGGTFFIPPSLA